MASFGWKNGPCATCACLYAPDGVMKVLQDPSPSHPCSSFCRQSVSGDTQTQSKAACRPSSYMGSHTKNEIYPPGGRHAALQAGAWSYGRRGSRTGWQEGDSLLGGGHQIKPTTCRGAPEREVKLALPPAEGSVLPNLPCFVCHCNVSN